MPGEAQIHVPEHPGDAFAVLYDLLRDSPAYHDRMVEGWLEDLRLLEQSERIRSSILAHGRLTPSIRSDLREANPHGVFTALLGIGYALEAASPYCRPNAADNVHWLVRQYNRTGRVDTGEVPGAVVFRASYPSGPMALPRPDTLFGLIRVTPEQTKAAERRSIPVVSDVTIVWEDVHQARRIRVGCIPTAEPEEIQLVAVEAGAGPSYRLVCREAALWSRVPDIIERLDKAGVDIAVVPEGCLTDTLLLRWKDVLRATSGTRPYESRLSWLVVGSGPIAFDPTEAIAPPNRAVVLDRCGNEIWSQDKQFDFSITDKQARDWNLNHSAGGWPRREDIRLGDKRLVVESRLGRVSIMICEDLSHTASAGNTLLGWGVSHVLVPVLSGGLRWAEGPAAALSKACGASVVVSNSRAIRLQRSEWNATMTSSITESHKDIWPKAGRSEDASDALDVRVSSVRPGGSLAWEHWNGRTRR